MTDPSQPWPEPATAIILAGGASTRLGFDKRRLLVGGVPIVEHLLRTLEPLFRQTLIGIDAEAAWVPHGAEVVVDHEPRAGPLVALVGCLSRSRYDLCFVVACDVPLLRLDLVRRLLDEARGRDGAVPIDALGRPEPLHGVYRRRLVPAIERLIASGERRPVALYRGHDFAFVRLVEFGMDAIPNINTPADVERLRDLLSIRE